LLFSGDKTPEQLAELAEEVIAKWREQSADAMKNFEIWAK